MKAFHGSYAAADVTLLLDPIVVDAFGKAPDVPPSPDAPPYSVQIASEQHLGNEYMGYFFSALERHKSRLAKDVLQVARSLAATNRDELVLASLVRGGTPIGVLIHRALKLLGRASIHYSISATRKRGSDPCALDRILQKHSAENILFVDGWTGKGYIASELHEAIASFNASRSTNLNPNLVVLADLAGVSSLAASADDYLIPSAMLRSIVCGLISPSMLNPFPASDLPDACLYYEHLLRYDCSVTFVDVITEEMRRLMPDVLATSIHQWGAGEREEAQCLSESFVANVMKTYGISDRKKVKPGLCEANRALLTRTTQLRLLVRDFEADQYDLANLLFLAKAKNVEVTQDSSLAYKAVVLLLS